MHALVQIRVTRVTRIFGMGTVHTVDTFRIHAYMNTTLQTALQPAQQGKAVQTSLYDSVQICSAVLYRAAGGPGFTARRRVSEPGWSCRGQLSRCPSPGHRTE